jgi:ATP-dependent RNA helicase SUPV3L1/SUV3
MERKTFLNINEGLADDGHIRSCEDAAFVLECLSDIQKKLWSCFEGFPSLIEAFSEEFGDFQEFVNRDNVLGVIFVEEFVFPESELMEISFIESDLLKGQLADHFKVLEDWLSIISSSHSATQELIKDNFESSMKIKDLACSCQSCVADYRAKLRDHIFNECLMLIEETSEVLRNSHEKDIDSLNRPYMALRKKIDKCLYGVKSRLRRSSLNRLESQVKSILKEQFCYPAEIAKIHSERLKEYCIELLRNDNLRKDLIEDETYERFFLQLSTNIWRNTKYLEREFKKLIKSSLLIKRKDISANILKKYLGEFWVHSRARDIKRKIIYHMGPTNSGKTYHAIESLCQAERGCYLAPLRLLASELYDTMNAKGTKTSLITGEEIVQVENSTHFSSTIEMAKFKDHYDCCVIDEIQMISDSQRGWAWTRALVNIFADEIHICGDGSVYDLIKQIVDLCGDELSVRNYDRMTELKVESSPIALTELKRSDALIVFSRRNALRYKMNLENLGLKVSIIYGRLGPEVRREQARKFDEGETDVIVSTDAISMGMNLPIKRIVFSTLSKFINSREHPITDSEIKQIAGRAGRFKRFPTGHVSTLQKVENGIDKIQGALHAQLPQKTKCMVGPDLDIYKQVNDALSKNNLPVLRLSEFLRLFNTMLFKKPFYCVNLTEMIELSEMVDEADEDSGLSTSEIFGFACAPVNLGLVEHVQHYVWILKKYVSNQEIYFERLDNSSDNIDYLETGIKCVELYQWLSRHFNNKNFVFDEEKLLANKLDVIDKLNLLLSDKILPTCSSCGVKLEEKSKFAICEECFSKRRFRGGGPRRKTFAKGEKSTGGRRTGSGKTTKKKFSTTKKKKHSHGKKKYGRK